MKIYTSEVNKIALNRDDDKRLVQADQISTLALGHYKKALEYESTKYRFQYKSIDHKPLPTKSR